MPFCSPTSAATRACLGDQTALGKIDQCLTLLGGIAHRYGGEIIKTIGDEILCAFSGAENAVEAAISMQQEMERAMGGMRIRIGLHSGEVIREGGDVFGDAVSAAARMAGLAAAAPEAVHFACEFGFVVSCGCGWAIILPHPSRNA